MTLLIDFHHHNECQSASKLQIWWISARSCLQGNRVDQENRYCWYVWEDSKWLNRDGYCECGILQKEGWVDWNHDSSVKEFL